MLQRRINNWITVSDRGIKCLEVLSCVHTSGIGAFYTFRDIFRRTFDNHRGYDDYVRLVPDSFYNYMGYQEEGTVYELLWEYECLDDTNSVLTKEQYQTIVSLAEW